MRGWFGARTGAAAEPEVLGAAVSASPSLCACTHRPSQQVLWFGLLFSVLSVKPFQDHKEVAIVTCPRIGVCKLDPSAGRCLTLTTLGKGGYAEMMRPENRL